jgi:hypothetical protein
MPTVMISLFQCIGNNRSKRWQCPKYNVSMNRKYLTIHMHEQDDFSMLQVPESHVSQPSQWYIMDFPIEQVETHCPVADCPAHPKTWYKLWHHFCMLHSDDIFVIVQEGKFQCCPHCWMFLKSITPRHVACESNLLGQAALIQEHERISRLAHLTHNIKFFVNGNLSRKLGEFKCHVLKQTLDD